MVGGKRHLRGFTLLELIVVIAIFAVFSLMAYGGLDSVLTTRRQVETAQNRLATYQRAYFLLRNDFQQVRYRPIRDAYGDTQPALRADDTGYVEFTRAGWPNPLLQPRAGLERVAYRYEDGKLIRVSWRVLDQAQDSKPVQATLLSNLDDVKWQYLDDARNWQATWPQKLINSQPDPLALPPIGVELTLRTKDFGELRFLFALGSDNPKIPERATTTAGNSSPTTGESDGSTSAAEQAPAK